MADLTPETLAEYEDGAAAGKSFGASAVRQILRALRDETRAREQAEHALARAAIGREEWKTRAHQGEREVRQRKIQQAEQQRVIDSLKDALAAKQVRAEQAEAEASRKGEANAALLRDRNTWARQLADLRGELDDARQELEDAIERAQYLDGERDEETLRTERAEAERDAARGDSPSGFWSQRQWEDWSNDLARLVPEEYEDDVAQEAIIERALADLSKRAEQDETRGVDRAIIESALIPRRPAGEGHT